MRLCKSKSLSTIFLNVFVAAVFLVDVAFAERNVLNDVNGVVGGGNYTYFMLKYEVRNFL